MPKSRGTTIKISGPGTAAALNALMRKPNDPPLDLVVVANSIADTIAKVTTPLTDEQRTFLAAALGPWFDRAASRRRVEQ